MLWVEHAEQHGVWYLAQGHYKLQPGPRIKPPTLWLMDSCPTLFTELHKTQSLITKGGSTKVLLHLQHLHLHLHQQSVDCRGQRSRPFLQTQEQWSSDVLSDVSHLRAAGVHVALRVAGSKPAVRAPEVWYRSTGPERKPEKLLRTPADPLPVHFLPWLLHPCFLHPCHLPCV